MSKYSRRVGAPIVIAAFAFVAACRSDAKKGPDSSALGSDSTLNRDLALAGRDTTAQPQLKDVPAATAGAPAVESPAKKTAIPRTAPRTAPRPPAKTSPAPAATPPATTTSASGN